MLKISDFRTSKYYKMRSIYDRDVLFFANDSRNRCQSLNFFTVSRLKLISIKTRPIYPCKKYLLGTKVLMAYTLVDHTTCIYTLLKGFRCQD